MAVDVVVVAKPHGKYTSELHSMNCNQFLTLRSDMYVFLSCRDVATIFYWSVLDYAKFKGILEL